MQFCWLSRTDFLRLWILGRWRKHIEHHDVIKSYSIVFNEYQIPGVEFNEDGYTEPFDEELDIDGYFVLQNDAIKELAVYLQCLLL